MSDVWQIKIYNNAIPHYFFFFLHISSQYITFNIVINIL